MITVWQPSLSSLIHSANVKIQFYVLLYLELSCTNKNQFQALLIQDFQGESSAWRLSLPCAFFIRERRLCLFHSWRIIKLANIQAENIYFVPEEMLLVSRNDPKAGPTPPCPSILTTSSCVSYFFLLHPHPISFSVLAPSCIVKSLSHLSFPLCCRRKPSKLSLKYPCPPVPPLPSADYCSPPLMKKPWCLRLISPGWISDSSLLFSFRLCFVFFSSSSSVCVCVCVCQWLMKWIKLVMMTGGWRRRMGWGFFMRWNNKMSEVHSCECVFSYVM